jgi:hypothetical protein
MLKEGFEPRLRARHPGSAITEKNDVGSEPGRGRAAQGCSRYFHHYMDVKELRKAGVSFNAKDGKHETAYENDESNRSAVGDAVDTIYLASFSKIYELAYPWKEE